MKLHFALSSALAALPLCLLAACSEPSTTEAQGTAQSGASASAETPAAEPNATEPVAATGTDTPATTAGAAAASKVVVTGTAPAAAEGKEVVATLVDAAGKAQGKATGTVSKGAFSLALDSNTAATTGGSVAAYVDLNGDKVCNIAPVDLGAKVAVQANSNVTLAIEANSTVPCSAFGDFDFVVGGTDFTPHNNQTIYAALLDSQSKAFVTEPSGSKVANGVWSVSMAKALVTGRTYEVHYFADLAGSGQCQNHSWVAKVAAQTQNANLTVSHDSAQTPVCTTFPALPTAAAGTAKK